MSGKFTTALYINKFSSATHIGKGTLAAFSEHIKGIVGNEYLVPIWVGKVGHAGVVFVDSFNCKKPTYNVTRRIVYEAITGVTPVDAPTFVIT